MKPLVIAGCQIPVTTDIQRNLDEIKRAIDWAAISGVDIISTPECALSGYMWSPSDNSDPKILQLSDAIKDISEYSKLKQVDLVLGTAWFNESNQWCDTLQFIINGNIEHVHYKNILFERYYTAGTGVQVIDYRGMKIAGLICSDLWANPMSYPDASGKLVRSLKEQGCNILFACANTPKGPQGHMFRDWHNLCAKMFSNLGKWYTVVSENTYKMEGNVWEGQTGVQCGIYLPSAELISAREHSIDYFKLTCYERTFN